MQIVLQVTAGPHQGKKVIVSDGQVATFGRTERADYDFPRDEQMSGLHFSLECRPAGCRLRDLQSANGTFLNGSPIQESAVQPTDVIRAGMTSFLVQIEAAVEEAEPIPDYLKGIVPRGARITGLSGNPAESPSAPRTEFLRPDTEPASMQTSFVDEGAYQLEAQRLEPQAEPASFLPPPQPAGGHPAPPSPAVPAAELSPSLSGSMRLVIEVFGGPHAGARMSLRAGDSLSVGRTDRADFVLARDLGLSGLHFGIRSVPGGFEVSDLGSTNGTKVNGEIVAATLLRDGDEIDTGQSRFKVQLEGVVAAPTESVRQVAAVSLHEGLRDPDPRVRHEALLAAVWTRQSWLLAHCRRQAEAPTAENWDAVLMLAILGTPAELSRIEAIAGAASLGPRRFRAVGAFGHPALVPMLLQAMTSDDPATAAAAAAAFHKITGCDVTSGRRVQVQPKDGQAVDDFERQFLEEVKLPDVSRATAHWKQAQGKFSSSERICRGFELGEVVSDEVFAELDMESRWEVRLHGRYYGTWQGSLRELNQV